MFVNFGFPYEVVFLQKSNVDYEAVHNIWAKGRESSSPGLNPPWAQRGSEALCRIPSINTACIGEQ